MKKRILWCLGMIIMCWSCTASAQQAGPVSVAVLPFETFGAAPGTALGKECALLLQQQLGRNPAIITPAPQQIQSVVGAADTGSGLTPERLKQLAKLLEANFLVFGSVTVVRNELSIDAQVYYNFPGDAYFKTYADGVDKAEVTAAVARKIEQEIMDAAAMVPPGQRPTASPAQTAAVPKERDKLAYEQAVEKELAAQRQAAPVAKAPAFEGPRTGERLEESELTRPGSEISTGAPVASADIVKTEIGDNGTERMQGARDATASRERFPGSGRIAFDQPVNITSDALEYDNKNNSAVFRGNVVARQADVVLFADSVSVVYGASADGSKERGRMRQLTAEGNVKVIQGERIATGQKIVFYNDEQKIVATGNPRVWQGDNVIVGSRITVYLKEDRSVVEGTMQDRVSATIYPKEKKKQGK